MTEDISRSAALPASRGGRFRKQSIAMAGGVLFSRLTGLVREQVLAYLFGTAGAMEAFVAAYRIPNLLRDLVAENVSTSAILPMYTKVREQEGREAVQRYTGAMLSLLLSVSIAIVLVGIAFAEPIAALIAPGYRADPELFRTTVLLTRWIFPFIALISVVAFFQAIQNAEQRFFVPAVATAGMNIGVIVFGWYLSTRAEPPILGMAWGVLLGGLLTVAILLPGFLRSVGQLRWGAHWKDANVKKTLLLAVPVVFGAASTNINVLVNTIVATFAEDGALAYLNYAYRVMFLPLGLIAVTIATVALSNLARSFHAGDHEEYRATLERAVIYAIMLALPAAAGLILLDRDIIGVIYNYGRFGEDALGGTALALTAYGIGVPAFALNRVFASGFYARNEPSGAVRIGVAGVGITILLNLLVLYLGFGFFGIALAASIAGWFQTILHAVAFRKRAPGALGKKTLYSLAAALAGIAAMAWCLVAIAPYMPSARLIRVPLEIGFGALAYSVVAAGPLLIDRIRKGF